MRIKKVFAHLNAAARYWKMQKKKEERINFISLNESKYESSRPTDQKLHQSTPLNLITKQTNEKKYLKLRTHSFECTKSKQHKEILKIYAK